MKHFQAIAAMSENRVIGDGNQIPWHLPEDFKWFKQKTVGNVVVMGRKTFESLPKPLPNRVSLILSRHPRQLIRRRPDIFGEYKEWRGGNKLKREYQLRFVKLGGRQNEDIRIFQSLKLLDPEEFPTPVFVCGGAQIYEQLLPRCSDLFLTHVKRTMPGDTFFPRFEDQLEEVGVLMETAEFKIVHYRHHGLL